MIFKLIGRTRIWSLNSVASGKLFKATSTINIDLFKTTQLRLCSGFSDRRYSPKHEWVSLENRETKIGTVGISDYAQEALGDVVYVQLPDLDSSYDQNDEVGAVESVKAASEIYTPVSGKVVEVNRLLEEKPGLVNSSCYGKGWLYKIQCSKVEEVDQLMDEETYKKYLKTIKEE